MKLFKLSSIVALFMALTAHSALADGLGKMDLEDVQKGKIHCLGKQSKGSLVSHEPTSKEGQGGSAQGSEAVNAQ